MDAIVVVKVEAERTNDTIGSHLNLSYLCLRLKLLS